MKLRNYWKTGIQQKMSSGQNPEVCDATDDAQGSDAGQKPVFLFSSLKSRSAFYRG
jgi:hypothetical protein